MATITQTTQDRACTSSAEVAESLEVMRETFRSGRTKDLRWRKWQLKQFWWMIEENEALMVEGLRKDLGRDTYESYSSDINGLKSDVLTHIEKLEKWTADIIPEAGFIFGTLGKARIRREPLGVALIIGAWNFPYIVTLQPVIAAIAAGCTVMIKPSELAPACEQVMATLVAKYLDPTAIRIVTGAAKETQEILSLKFDHIFFTGSPAVGRHIAAAAAKNLTPTVLELGGQAPAIVTKSANIDLAAKRIGWGKFTNAGQICLSINHVFVDPSIHVEFIAKAKYWYDTFQGKESQMASIINERNYDRLQKLLDATKGSVVYGSPGEKTKLKLKPTIIDNIKMDDSLMSEELFGPFLPVIEATTAEACTLISNLPHPLGIYLFSTDQKEIDYILDHTLSGGVTINDVLVHAGIPDAPFGGVGDSGMGAYHGHYGVDAFSHMRSVVGLPMWLDKVMAFRYPPYDTVNHPTVKNRLGFKRGESLEQQVIGGESWLWSTLTVAVPVIGATWYYAPAILGRAQKASLLR